MKPSEFKHKVNNSKSNIFIKIAAYLMVLTLFSAPFLILLYIIKLLLNYLT